MIQPNQTLPQCAYCEEPLTVPFVSPLGKPRCYDCAVEYATQELFSATLKERFIATLQPYLPHFKAAHINPPTLEHLIDNALLEAMVALGIAKVYTKQVKNGQG
jgi:hypothetical protein